MTGRWPIMALIVSAGLFGVSSTGTKYALGGFGPLTVLTVELLATTAVLWLFMLRRGYRRPGSLRRVALMGLLEPGLAYLLFSLGLDRTSASIGAVVSGLESGFVVILAAIFLRERAGWSVLVAVGIAVLGIVALEGWTTITGPGLGDVLLVGGTLSAALYTVLARGLPVTDDSLTVTAHQFAVGTALVLPLAVISWRTGAERVPVGVPLRFWVVAALIGIFGFGASFLLYNAAIVAIPAGPAGILLNLAPVFGLATAVYWLGESLTAAKAVGATVIGISVALSLVAERRRAPATPHNPASGGDAAAVNR